MKGTIYDNARYLTTSRQKRNKKVQQISGTFLYYGLAIDPTILPALNEIATQQSAPTENTLKK